MAASFSDHSNLLYGMNRVGGNCQADSASGHIQATISKCSSCLIQERVFTEGLPQISPTGVVPSPKRPGVGVSPALINLSERMTKPVYVFRQYGLLQLVV